MTQTPKTMSGWQYLAIEIFFVMGVFMYFAYQSTGKSELAWIYLLIYLLFTIQFSLPYYKSWTQTPKPYRLLRLLVVAVQLLLIYIGFGL